MTCVLFIDVKYSKLQTHFIQLQFMFHSVCLVFWKC